jgi:hypothetical protein
MVHRLADVSHPLEAWDYLLDVINDVLCFISVKQVSPGEMATIRRLFG